MSTPYRNPIVFYYGARWLSQHHVPLLPGLLQSLLFLLCNAVVPYRADIQPGCRLAHGGGGVVIHPAARIGRNVLIGQQVTIGGAAKAKAVPVIGDDVYIGAGAKILGPITVGSNCVIGANAVVVKPVGTGCVVAGVPARVLREGINAHDIESW